MQATYRLAPHIHVCVTDDAAIFIDLRRDAYVGLDEAQSRALSAVVEGWPSSPSFPTGNADAVLLAESLCERELLTSRNRGGLGHSAAPPSVQCPTEQLIEWDQMRFHVRLGEWATFAPSLLVAIVMLRVFGLERAVARVRARRRLCAGCRFDVPRARRAVSAFYHVRPFFYASKGRCLLDSLTLIEFLAHYGLHPTWVIGVQARPFAAHSWVQHENFVLNGTPDYVRAYQPILAI